MRNINEHTITQAVLASFANCENRRLHTIMTSLVQHLHAFAREVHLTDDEWFKAISFLTEAGHITDDKRQEFILLSDTLGLSMLVTSQNNEKPAHCTEATVFRSVLRGGSADLRKRRRHLERGTRRGVLRQGSSARSQWRTRSRCMARRLAIRRRGPLRRPGPRRERRRRSRPPCARPAENGRRRKLQLPFDPGRVVPCSPRRSRRTNAGLLREGTRGVRPTFIS